MNRWRAAVLVAVVLAGCAGSPAEGHPLDDLDAAALAHVLPDEVTELRSRTLRFSRVLAGPALRSPLHIVVEPDGRPDDVADLLRSGHRVVAGIVTEGLVRPGVAVVVAIDDRGRAAAIGPTGGYTTADLARASVGSTSAEAYLRSTFGWRD